MDRLASLVLLFRGNPVAACSHLKEALDLCRGSKRKLADGLPAITEILTVTLPRSLALVPLEKRLQAIQSGTSSFCLPKDDVVLSCWFFEDELLKFANGATELLVQASHDPQAFLREKAIDCVSQLIPFPTFRQFSAKFLLYKLGDADSSVSARALMRLRESVVSQHPRKGQRVSPGDADLDTLLAITSQCVQTLQNPAISEKELRLSLSFLASSVFPLLRGRTEAEIRMASDLCDLFFGLFRQEVSGEAAAAREKALRASQQRREAERAMTIEAVAKGVGGSAQHRMRQKERKRRARERAEALKRSAIQTQAAQAQATQAQATVSQDLADSSILKSILVGLNSILSIADLSKVYRLEEHVQVLATLVRTCKFSLGVLISSVLLRIVERSGGRRLQATKEQSVADFTIGAYYHLLGRPEAGRSSKASRLQPFLGGLFRCLQLPEAVSDQNVVAAFWRRALQVGLYVDGAGFCVGAGVVLGRAAVEVASSGRPRSEGREISVLESWPFRWDAAPAHGKATEAPHPYRPTAAKPASSGAATSTPYELLLLKRHYHPAARCMASAILSNAYPTHHQTPASLRSGEDMTFDFSGQAMVDFVCGRRDYKFTPAKLREARISNPGRCLNCVGFDALDALYYDYGRKAEFSAAPLFTSKRGKAKETGAPAESLVGGEEQGLFMDAEEFARDQEGIVARLRARQEHRATRGASERGGEATARDLGGELSDSTEGEKEEDEERLFAAAFGEDGESDESGESGDSGDSGDSGESEDSDGSDNSTNDSGDDNTESLATRRLFSYDDEGLEGVVPVIPVRGGIQGAALRQGHRPRGGKDLFSLMSRQKR